MAADSGILECVAKECGREKVMVEGKCYHVDEKIFCPGSGEAMFLNERGEPSCQCRYGWGRKERTEEEKTMIFGGKRKKKTVKSGGRCYQELTRGFCTDNLIVKSFEENRLGCINNPCGKSTESVPH